MHGVRTLVAIGVLAAGLLASPVLVPAQVGELTDAQRGWALAAAGVITESNAGRHDLLAGHELSDAYRMQAQQVLEDWWDVHDRADLLQAMRWIHAGGHRASFEQIAARLAAMTAEERADIEPGLRARPDIARRLAVVEAHAGALGARSLLGWDYGRYIALARWGYASGYLAEGEAWEHIIRSARLLQATFGSWRELGENYLVGREFWSPAQQRHNGHLYRAALARLLERPESPWHRYAWSLDLGGRAPEPPAPGQPGTTP